MFDVTQLPASEYALSLGLSTAPKLRFLRKAGRKVHEVSQTGGWPNRSMQAAFGSPIGFRCVGRWIEVNRTGLEPQGHVFCPALL